MSSLDKTNADKAAASSSGGLDPALQREIDEANLPKSRGTALPNDGQSLGDDALHLQNAHYGTRDVDARKGEGDASGGTFDGQTPPPAAFDLDGHPGVPKFGDTAAKGDLAKDDTGSTVGRGGPAGSEGGNSQSENATPKFQGTSSFKTGNGSAATLGTEQSDAAPGATSGPASVAQADNQAPTDIELSNATIAENAAGAVVGTLTSVDADAGDQFSYEVSDGRFEVVDGQLKLKDGMSLDHESEPSVSISVTSSGGRTRLGQ